MRQILSWGGIKDKKQHAVVFDVRAMSEIRRSKDRSGRKGGEEREMGQRRVRERLTHYTQNGRFLSK